MNLNVVFLVWGGGMRGDVKSQITLQSIFRTVLAYQNRIRSNKKHYQRLIFIYLSPKNRLMD